MQRRGWILRKCAMSRHEPYSAPGTLEEAARIVAGRRVAILAGGTDMLPRWSRGVIPSPDAVVDLKRIAELRGTSRTNGEVCIGACTALSDVASDAAICTAAPVLARAAGRVACGQVRNRATIGGNLCNASPAADTAVPLILLDAVVELASMDGNSLAVREVPVADFFRGPGSTVLTPGEILTRIRFKTMGEGVFADWDKFGTRPAMEIAVASVGVALEMEDGRITRARVGFGSVAPVPLRGRRAEAELLGRHLSADVIGECAAVAQKEIAPISDVRASAAFRRELVGVMLRRMLERARPD